MIPRHFDSLSLHGFPSGASKSREAGTGIEPVNSGFADRGLTTWLPRRIRLPDSVRWRPLVCSVSVAMAANFWNLSNITAP